MNPRTERPHRGAAALRAFLLAPLLFAAVACAKAPAFLPAHSSGEFVSYQSDRGYSVVVPEPWLVLASSTLPEALDDPRLSVMDAHTLREFRAGVETREKEYFVGTVIDGGMETIVVITAHKYPFPETSALMDELCTGWATNVSEAVEGEALVRTCEPHEVDGHRAVRAEIEAPDGWRSMEYLIEARFRRTLHISTFVGPASGAELRRLLHRLVASWKFDVVAPTETLVRLAARPDWLFPADGCPADVMPEENERDEYGPDYCRLQLLCVGRCRNGHAQSCYALALALEEEQAERVYQQALFLRACRLGVPSACTNRAAGIMLEPGRTRADEECTRVTFERTCEAGDPWGCTMFGFHLRRGIGGEQDLDAALEVLRRGCARRRSEESCVLARKLEDEIRAERASSPSQAAPASD